jgi:hypothetical protein
MDCRNTQLATLFEMILISFVIKPLDLHQYNDQPVGI